MICASFAYSTVVDFPSQHEVFNVVSLLKPLAQVFFSGLMGVGFIFQIYRQLVLYVLVDGEGLTRRTLLGEFRLDIEDVNALQLWGRYAPFFSMSLKLWHPSGQLMITNYEFSNRQVLAIADQISTLLLTDPGAATRINEDYIRRNSPRNSSIK